MMTKVLALLALSLAGSLAQSFGQPVRAQDGQPTTPPEATSVPMTPARTGTVVGQLANGTAGANVPENLAVMLHAWDEAGETLMLDGQVDAQGAFRFENVEMQANWTFAAMLNYNEVTFFSESVPVLPDLNELSLPLTVYETTTDTLAVRVAQLHTFLEYTGGEVTVGEVYVLSNDGDRVVAGGVALPDGRTATLEFAVAAGANKVSFGANATTGRFGMIDAERFADTAPLLPGEGSAQVVVQYTLPYEAGMEIAHPILYPVDGLNVIQRAEAGVAITGPGLGEPAPQTMADGGNYVLYTSGPLEAPAGVAMTLAGTPNEVAPDAAAPAAGGQLGSGVSADLGRLALPIAGGVLGLALIGCGALWLRRSDRPADEEDLEPGDELDTAPEPEGDWSSIVRAIATLDAAHERGQVTEPDYSEQRAALKAQARALLQVEQSGD